MARSLTIESFMVGADMVASHLRVKDVDRWSPQVGRLKYHSFTGEFPEVNDKQFLWSCEKWIQGLPPGFTRYPTWRELMAPLYRTENGLANRSWGFNPMLPPALAPSAEQLLLLPTKRRSIAAVPDPGNAEAYVPFETDQLPMLPPAADETPLTPKRWNDYLRWVKQEEAAAVER